MLKITGNVWSVAKTQTGKRLKVVDESGFSIATVTASPRARHNANLLAASPAMLALLQGAEDRLATLDDAEEATDNDLALLDNIRNLFDALGVDYPLKAVK